MTTQTRNGQNSLKCSLAPENKIHHPHTSSATHPFLSRLSDAGMKESKESVVRLPEADADAFRHVIYWLYHGRMEYQLGTQFDTMTAEKVTARTIINTYLLAQMWLIEALQNAAVDNIRGNYEYHHHCATTLALIHSYTPTKVPLRRMAMQKTARVIARAGGWAKWKTHLPNSTYNDFARSSVNNMEFIMDSISEYPDAVNPYYSVDPCQWHVHLDTEKSKKAT